MGGLYRSKRSKVILGVCGGLAEYFRVDPVLIRIICVVISFSGAGILLYLVAALIMPEDKGYSDSQWNSSMGQDTGSYAGTGSFTGGGSYTGENKSAGSSFEDEFNSDADNWERPAKYDSEKNRTLIGAILIGLGVLFLGKQLMPGLFDLKYMVPVLLVVIGGIIVYRGRR